MHRLFVAIRPPAPVRDRLIDLMEGVPGARWQDEEQLHLTLRFIGEVDAHVAGDALAALRSVSHRPFALTIDGVGNFGKKGKPHTIWAGVAPHDEVSHLRRKVDQALVRAGLEPERRAYHPHITLARINRAAAPLDGFLSLHAGLSGPAFDATHFGLYESHMGQGGSTYELVERFAME